MNYRIVFTAAFLIIAFQLFAQTDFRPGYIVKGINDTVYGEIDYRGDQYLCESCRFRKQDNSVFYSPSDIQAYRFSGSRYFVSREVQNKQVFIECLFKGLISIYYLRDDIGDHLYLEKADSGLTEIPYEEHIKVKNEFNQYLIKSKTHIGILKYYMQDEPGFTERIEKIEIPDRDNLVNLARDYHYKVCPRLPSYTYMHIYPLISLDFEFDAGAAFYRVDNFRKNNFAQFGFLTHMWMPRINEKIYLRTGLLCSVVQVDNVYGALFKIPLQLEYIYPTGTFRPMFAYGLSMQTYLHYSVSCMVGVKYKFKSGLSMNLVYDIDFKPSKQVPLLPGKLRTNTFLLGIVLK